jgi:hypothetical protein
MEFDGAGPISRLRSYYDKLAVMDQVAPGLPGASGWTGAVGPAVGTTVS